MKNVFKIHLICLALFVSLLSSCTSDSDPAPSYPSLEGKFFVNEGSFNKNNGTISFYAKDGSIEKDIFKSVNGNALGDIVQDFEIVDTLGFIVVNNSKKVEIVRMRDFVSVATFSGDDVTYPRFVAQATESTVYITDGATAGNVLIYDFKKLEYVGKITVGNGPEMMIKKGNKMYVANSGGWSVDNTISVIDIEQGEVVKTIEVDFSSVDMELDANDNIWVYSKGSSSPTYSYDNPKIFKVSTETDEVIQEFELPVAVGSFGSNLLAVSTSGSVYYTTDALYKMSVDATELPNSKLKDVAYYGIEVDSKSNELYLMDSAKNEVIVVNGDDASEETSYTNTMPYTRAVIFNE